MKTLQSLLAAALVLPLPALAQGGSLTPPGPPAPLFKTLDQVEPRTPLVVGAAGVTTDATFAFVINQPGSYYLTGNLTVSATGGIQIAASSVTLDLNGYVITGSGSATGVEIAKGGDAFVVKNGSIVAFDNGLRATFSEN